MILRILWCGLLAFFPSAGLTTRAAEISDDFTEGVVPWLSSPGWTLVELASGETVFRGDSIEDTFSQNSALALGDSWRLEVDVRFRRYYADGSARALMALALFPSIGSGVQFEANLGHRTNASVQIDAQWFDPGNRTWHNVLQTDWLPSQTPFYRLHLFRASGSDHLTLRVTSTNGFNYWAETAAIPLETLNRMKAFGLRVNSSRVEFDNLRAISPYTPPAPPQIIRQPESQTVTSGAAVTFRVIAAGTGPYSYQWMRGKTIISGATNDSYTIKRAVPAFAGDYKVVVGNPDTRSTSLPASLKVIDAFMRLADSVIPGNVESTGIALEVKAPTNMNFIVQQSEDLKAWIDVTNSVGVGSPVNLHMSSDASKRLNFYRLAFP